MGARLTVKGWPRGRTTTAAWSNVQWETAEMPWMVWPSMRSPDFQIDLLYDKCYHEQQKQMFDRWHENYREHHFKHSRTYGNLR